MTVPTHVRYHSGKESVCPRRLQSPSLKCAPGKLTFDTSSVHTGTTEKVLMEIVEVQSKVGDEQMAKTFLMMLEFIAAQIRWLSS